MLPEEKFRVLVFAASVAAVFGLSVLMLLTRLVPGLKDSSLVVGAPENCFVRFFIYGFIGFRNLVFTLAVFGILCLAYATFFEPYWLEVKHVHLTNAKLAAGSRPIRIVQISDLHSIGFPRLESILPSVVAEQRPDIIAFTGDTIETTDGLPVFKACLARMAQIAPTFAVTGNWDDGPWRHMNLFGGTGARLLHAEAVKIPVAGTDLYVAGVPADYQRMWQALQAVPADKFTVFLDHYSDRIYDPYNSKVDLYLAGHTHGGQIALPFYGALVTFSKFGKRFESGLYRVNNTWMYVNRGIGMDIVPMRFCARPEVTVFDIYPSGSGQR